MAVDLVAIPETENLPPRINLRLQWDGQTSARIYRQDPDGVRRFVRTANPAALTAGVWLGFDYETFFGSPFAYEVEATAQPTFFSPAVALDVTQVWLKHLGVPALSMPVDVNREEDEQLKVNRSSGYPEGSRYPLVRTDGRRKAKTSTLKIRTWTLEEYKQLKELLDDCTPLLLDVPTAWRWGIEHQYVAISEAAIARLVPDKAWYEGREFVLPYEEVGQPSDTGIQALRTYRSVKDENATYADILAKYLTYETLLTGTEI